MSCGQERSVQSKPAGCDVGGDVDRHVAALGHELAGGHYQPSVGRCVHITDPKPRWIYALPFRDRVAQHLLIARTLPGVYATSHE